jgi:regulator of sigma E protease
MDLIYFLLLIGPLVFAHELGHFLMAKAFRIRVLKFSLGFGPVLLGRQIGETFYQIAWVPLGGFVKFLGDDPRDEVPGTAEERKRSWSESARWKRALVVVAGPAMSLVFPVICYFFVGLLVNELRAPTIGQVIPESPADRAGLRAGDRVLRIDGDPVYGFFDLQQVISTRPGEDLDVVVSRDGEEVALKIRPALVRRARFAVLDIYENVGQIGVHNVFPAPVIGVLSAESPAGRAGLETFDLVTSIDGRPVKRWLDAEKALRELRPGQPVKVAYLRPQKAGWPFLDVYVQQPGQTTLTPGDGAIESPADLGIELASLYISFVVDDMPGAKAGLRPGEKILAVDGRRIQLWEQLEDAFNNAPTQAHTVTVERDGVEVDVTLRPERYTLDDMYTGERETYKEPGIGVYRVGVLDDPVPNTNRWSRAAVDAVRETLDMIKYNAIGLLRIAQGRVSFRTIGGPIMLWQLAGSAGRQGAHTFLTLLALISVMLGLLNLMPIPVLDGGQLVVLAVEGIRRQPLTIRAREIINIAGLVLLVLLMVVAFKNDIQRYWDWEDFTGLFR